MNPKLRNAVACRNAVLILGAAVLALLVAAGAFSSVLNAAPAAPPTFTVNSTFDIVASGPLDNGVCETGLGNNVCTLRAAIMKANHYPGGGVTINLPLNVLPYKLTLAPVVPNDETTGDLNISNTLTINGAGPGQFTSIIDGNATDRIFYINTPGAVTITGVTIRNGKTNSLGGGLYIYSGALALSNSTFTGNHAFHGGGLSATGFATVTVSSVIFGGNSASFQGGGVYSEGSSSVTYHNSTIINNTAGSYGGGISTIIPLNLNGTSVSGNSAGVDGGGIHVESLTGFIANSTINANRAAGNGGGIDTYGSALNIQNSTISANAAHGNGGGIAQAGTPGGMHLFHATIAGNIADSDAAAAGFGGGIYRNPSATANELWNSIVAENFAATAHNDCDGGFTTSWDYNYIQGLLTCPWNGTPTHDRLGGDAWLDALKDNGGPTPTRALFDTSPAVNWIPTNLCRDALGVAPNPDQRGVIRPIGSFCDIGAYEGSVSAAPLYRNLIRNGDAENGSGSAAGAFIGAPNWSVAAGQFTVVPYNSAGGFPAVPTDTVPAGHGYNFFAGGSAGDSRATQVVTVTALSAQIDAGQINFSAAGEFGGYATQDDNATLAITFKNAGGSTVGVVYSFGGVTAAGRGNATGFRHATTGGVVPAGTRTIEVAVEMLRSIGSGYNDGYADNLSLLLTVKNGILYLPMIQR